MFLSKWDSDNTELFSHLVTWYKPNAAEAKCWNGGRGIYAIQIMCFEKGRRALWNHCSHCKEGGEDALKHIWRIAKGRQQTCALDVWVLWLTEGFMFKKSGPKTESAVADCRNKSMYYSEVDRKKWECYRLLPPGCHRNHLNDRPAVAYAES